MLACTCVAVAASVAEGQKTPAPSARGPAYRLIALPSGHVIAEARPDILATPVAPGSLVKIATLVAAVEDGLIDERTRIECHRAVTVDGKRLACVHPDLHRPLTAVEALGHSCNVFFATVAQRLSRQSLDAVLVRMGLPPLTPGSPTASGAVGLAGIKATPLQLLEAFLRTVGPSPREMAMPEPARRMVRAGTELAARNGTAAALASAGFSGLAKTGTAPMPGGGYAGIVTAEVNSELPTHAIVVFVPGGAGADAAEVAARVLAGHGAPGRGGTVRVGIARRGGGYDTRVLPIDDYVSRVVAGEMGQDAAPAALEAMAITARTFLDANRGRHAAEGFEVCDLTHCQALGRANAKTEAAARATSGLILVDHGRPADVYYSSWCGGHTESPSGAWRGAKDAAYLPARPDPACAAEPPWTSEIPEPRLRLALRAAGLRGDVVTSLSVASRHPSGRVDELAVGGMAPGRIDGNAFRSAAGRVLGWQTVKSTLFDVTRSAGGYVLTGRGAGHGVGLCIRGAINRGHAGATRDEILAAYFPGLAVAPRSRADRAAASPPPAETAIRVLLPEADRSRLDDVRAIASRALREVTTRLAVAPPREVTLVFHPTVEAYSRATGQPWWTSARTDRARIDLLPRTVLEERHILEPTLRHELVHLVAEPTLAGRPLWVREGLAVAIADEVAAEPAGKASRDTGRSTTCPADDALREPRSADAWRRAYDAAGRCVADALAAGRRWQDLR